VSGYFTHQLTRRPARGFVARGGNRKKLTREEGNTTINLVQSSPKPQCYSSFLGMQLYGVGDCLKNSYCGGVLCGYLLLNRLDHETLFFVVEPVPPVPRIFGRAPDFADRCKVRLAGTGRRCIISIFASAVAAPRNRGEDSIGMAGSIRWRPVRLYDRRRCRNAAVIPPGIIRQEISPSDLIQNIRGHVFTTSRMLGNWLNPRHIVGR
jgi:hypothetical protein